MRKKTIGLIKKELYYGIEEAKKSGFNIGLSVEDLYEKYKESLFEVFDMPHGSSLDPYEYAEGIIYKEIRRMSI